MDVITQSQITTWLTCQVKAKLRYFDGLTPNREADDALRLGTLIHEGLDLFYTHGPSAAADIVAFVGKQASEDSDPLMRLRVEAMLKAYFDRHIFEDFEVVAVEMPFEGMEIVNPATGAKSRTFSLSGKVDVVVRRNKRLWVMEHKTASVVDDSYVQRLPMDFQIITYRRAVEKLLGEPVEGVLYNVLLKNKLSLRAGETEEEYLAREAARSPRQRKEGETDEKYAARIAKLEPLKRDWPETMEQLAARMAEFHAKPEAFFRTELVIGFDRDRQFQQQLWNVCQQILFARREDAFAMNNKECVTRWGSACPYLALCTSNGDPFIKESEYQVKPPHGELEEKSNGFAEFCSQA